MAKKKKGKLSDGEALKLIEEIVVAAGTVPKEVYITVLFTYLWWKAYGGGKMPTIGDIALGALYAVTVPNALQGGVLANTYALGVLGALGAGYIPGGVVSDITGAAGDLVDFLEENANAAVEVFGPAPRSAKIPGWWPPIVVPPGVFRPFKKL